MATDLSHLVPGMAPESQAATNTVSSNAAMTAPGSASESTLHEAAGDPMTGIGDAARGDYRPVVHGGGGGQAAGRWEDVSGRRGDWGPAR